MPAGLAVLLAAVLSLTAGAARAEDDGWPRQFDTPSGSFVIYQPQPEGMNGNVLTGRAAFSLQKEDQKSPTFGVLWFAETIQIDRDSSTVNARDLDVTKVRLPGITPEEAGRYERLVESEATRWDLSGSLDELRAGLAAAEKERASAAGLDNTPPRIIFHDRRAILVVYDGQPQLESVEGTDVERVGNTPYAVLFDPRSNRYYLAGANLWYRSRDPLGPWSNIPDPPGEIRDLVPPDTSSADRVVGPPPDVLTATEPTELIATDGRPRYAPLVADTLLYVTNTESDVIMDVDTQELYVLLSGRWFQAPSEDGPWSYVRGDQLPSSFQSIPPDSPKGNVLASVAGTEQAEDALADAEIPQTSAIRRVDRTFDTAYDGDPEFERIDGTDLSYATNTDAEVILADGRYYACDQGVWYVADDPEGPWIVSDTRPLGIEDIPPSCPVYDTRYVYVYDVTPDVVYVGYLPGYLGWYPYYGTVVYGTGYHYRPWRSRHHYFARNFTWGFQARYNPWLSRWSFGFSYDSGFLRVGTRWRSGVSADAKASRSRSRSRWFGAGGYRRPLLAQDLTPIRERRRDRVRTRATDSQATNIYTRPENVARIDLDAMRTIRSRSIARSFVRPGPAVDDVFAGKDGRVYRRDTNGRWQVREGTEWRPVILPADPNTTRFDLPEGRPVIQPGGSRQPANVQRPVPAGEKTETRPEERQRPPQQRPMRPVEQPVEGTQVEKPAPQPVDLPVERRTPSGERPRVEERRTPSGERSRVEERRTPSGERSTPGNLEREYRARQRSERSEPRVEKERPAPESRERAKTQESPKEKPRPRDEGNRDRGGKGSTRDRGDSGDRDRSR
ncbi:MAG: carbohydrate-binding family V/XII [Bacteroidota bacterium]